MFVFQADRFLLRKHVSEVAHYITGKTLDVGAGEYARYDQLFPQAQCIKMDIRSGDNVDVVGTADDIPFGNNEFKSVICTQVFEHLAEPFISAGEIFRVLQPGGHVLVTVPQMNELHEEPHDYFRYTKFGLRYMFESKGFEVLECVQRGGYFTTMSQMRTRYFIDRFNLYEAKFFGRVISYVLRIHSKFCIYLDTLDKSEANLKHTIGWTVILKKPNEDSNLTR